VAAVVVGVLDSRSTFGPVRHEITKQNAVQIRARFFFLFSSKPPSAMTKYEMLRRTRKKAFALLTSIENVAIIGAKLNILTCRTHCFSFVLNFADKIMAIESISGRTLC
jgi:hypothetical protein